MAAASSRQGRVVRLMRHLRHRIAGPLPELIRADHVELYTTGERFFDALFTAIGQAQALICLEYYIVRADRTGARLAGALAAAVERGVQVFLLYDAIGCHDTPSAYFSGLRRNGVQCLAFNPFSLRRGIRWYDRRDHRKLTIVDGQLAFLGGLNIGDEYAGLLDAGQSFHDVGLSLNGAAAVSLLSLFAASWAQEQGSFPVLPALPKPATPVRPGMAVLSLISGSPHHQRSSIRAAFRVAMASATEELLIVNPYFIPGPRIIRSLLRAARRQVHVQLLLPARSDVPLVRLVSRSSYEALLKAGIEIFELERQPLHAKLMLIDRKRTVLGSANLDQRSFHRNYEINAIIRSTPFGYQVRELFEQDIACSRRITLDGHARRGMLPRLLETMFRPICWFL